MNQDTISEETGIYSSETEYFSPFVPPMFASKHDAILAALELRQKFENIKRKWIEIWSKDLGNSKISLDVKCEINTGAVSFGLLDTDTMSQVTIIESPANLSSKLESFAEKDQIIISPDVRDLIQGEFELQK